MDPTIRLRIATRIHFALLRHYGEDVAVSNLLKSEDDAREALWVCDASGHEELIALAKQFRAAPKPVPRIERAGAVTQELAWAADTSGFGVSQLPDAAPAAKSAGWLSASRWLGGGGRTAR